MVTNGHLNLNEDHLYIDYNKNESYLSPDVTLYQKPGSPDHLYLDYSATDDHIYIDYNDILDNIDIQVEPPRVTLPSQVEPPRVSLPSPLLARNSARVQEVIVEPMYKQNTHLMNGALTDSWASLCAPASTEGNTESAVSADGGVLCNAVVIKPSDGSSDVDTPKTLLSRPVTPSVTPPVTRGPRVCTVAPPDIIKQPPQPPQEPLKQPLQEIPYQYLNNRAVLLGPSVQQTEAQINCSLQEPDQESDQEPFLGPPSPESLSDQERLLGPPSPESLTDCRRLTRANSASTDDSQALLLYIESESSVWKALKTLGIPLLAQDIIYTTYVTLPDSDETFVLRRAQELCLRIENIATSCKNSYILENIILEPWNLFDDSAGCIC